MSERVDFSPERAWGSHCVPSFPYASTMKDYSGRQMTKCTVALYDEIKKIFTFQRWESVRNLRECFGYSSLTLSSKATDTSKRCIVLK